MKQGKVFLVGAGPGDYRLITSRGLTELKNADIIYYDRLVNPSILSLVPSSIKKVYVGKAPGNHHFTQKEINELLIKKAKEGKRIVRLKGGDPFVFGRGGEEAVKLAENDIDFEIIPGITSVIGAPAYAGIPVTHRNKSSSFHVYTGHSIDKLDFDNLSQLKGTMIFVMGLKNLENITGNLIAKGVSPGKDIAVIYYGTTGDQKTVRGKLNTIVNKVTAENIEPPVIIIIGEVVELADSLKWFDQKPLSQKRVMVTRPFGQQQELGRELEKIGIEVFYYPVINITGPVINEQVKKALNSIKKYDWIFLTSPNGVKYLFKLFKKMNIDLRELSSVKFAVIGSGTKKVLKEKGINADFIPDKFTTNSFGREFVKKEKNPQKIILTRSNLAEKRLVDILKKGGQQPLDINIYKTNKIKDNKQLLLTGLKERTLDLITFTSPSTVRYFAENLSRDFKNKIKKIPVICIGPVTAKEANNYGFKVEKIASPHTISGLVDVIRNYLSELDQRF